jgi:hypothetical protein
LIFVTSKLLLRNLNRRNWEYAQRHSQSLRPHSGSAQTHAHTSQRKPTRFATREPKAGSRFFNIQSSLSSQDFTRKSNVSKIIYTDVVIASDPNSDEAKTLARNYKKILDRINEGTSIMSDL